MLPPPVKRPLQARFFSTTPALLCTVPQLPLPIPVVKVSSLGIGLKPQQPTRVVVVVVVTIVVVVVATGAEVVVVATGAEVVVVATGAEVVVVATGPEVVVVATGPVVVVVATGAVVVVVSVGTVVVVVVPPGGGHVPPGPHASQQLDWDPTHAVPPGGVSQFSASFLIEQVVLPSASVWQQVTKPGLPQVDAAAQPTTASLHSARNSPSPTAAFTTCATQLTYLP